MVEQTNMHTSNFCYKNYTCLSLSTFKLFKTIYHHNCQYIL